MVNIGVRLEGKVALVTGAARGLGRAMTLGLMAHGARVGAMDRDADSPERLSLIEEANTYGRDSIVPLTGDITDPAACEQAVSALEAKLGKVDVLINNAGVGMELMGEFLHKPFKFYEVPVPIWQKIVDTNINGTFNMSRAVAPKMVSRGWGRIINVSGRLFVMLRKGLSPYGVTKAALESATAIWSSDLEGTGVTVNSLSPGGLVDTRMIPSTEFPDRKALLRPEVMIPPTVWLASDRSDGTTGMRFTGKDWDLNLDPAKAAEKASIRALVGETIA